MAGGVKSAGQRDVGERRGRVLHHRFGLLHAALHDVLMRRQAHRLAEHPRKVILTECGLARQFRQR